MASSLRWLGYRFLTQVIILDGQWPRRAHIQIIFDLLPDLVITNVLSYQNSPLELNKAIQK